MLKNIAGQRFGRLVVISRAGAGSPVRWRCHCDCGQEKTIASSSLRYGLTRSCGCLWKEWSSGPHTHGLNKTPISRAYYGMRSRCLNPKNKEYTNYGGRGIKICRRWIVGNGVKSGIECFASDMGPKPSPSHTLERINVNGNYQPSNCCWATRIEQAANRRLTARDGKQRIVEIASSTGIKYRTLMDRFRRGDRGERLTRPIQRTRRWHSNQGISA